MDISLVVARTNLIRLWGIFLFVSVVATAQNTAEYKEYKNVYPNAHSVRLNQETRVSIRLNDNNFEITQETLEEDLYLDESATFNSKQSLSFSTFYELEEIEASAYILDKDNYKESEVTDFKQKDELTDSFYDDTKSVNFIYPNLNQGSKTKLKYRHRIKNPRFLNAFYFGNFYPIVSGKLTIVADKNIVLEFMEFNTDSIPVSFSKKEGRRNIEYSWKFNDIEEFESEANTPSHRSFLPHIIPIIRSYTTKNGQETVLKDVSDLYDWYYSLVKDINKDEADEQLVKVVERITSGKESDLEKARAIYYWTQENIKYIAFEYALGGFVPREANAVFQKKYGDCKDNSSLLYKMMEIAGLKGNLTWIGTREIPYRYNEVPTPLVDNHMILAYRTAEGTYFLDATGRYASLELPTSFIQGKEALVAVDENDFQIIEVPVIPAEKNGLVEIANIQLENGNIKGKATSEISGYKKVDYFYSLEKKNTALKINDFYNRAFEKGNNSFLIKGFTEQNKYDYDRNLIVEYTFEIDNHAKVLGDEIYVNLNMNKRASDFKSEEDRKNVIEFDYKDFYHYETVLELPEGYKVDYLPSSVDLKNEFFSSTINYRTEERKVVYEHTLKANFLSLSLDDQKKVNKLISQIEKEYKEVIVLKKNN